MILQQNPVDPTLPQSMDLEDVGGWALLFDDLLRNLFDPGSAPLLGMGMTLWTGLSTIVVVWTGLRIAFAGASFRPWEFVTLIMGLSIPLGMLRFYAIDVPGVGLPFPFIVPAGADMIADAFSADLSTEMQLAQANMNEAMSQNLDAATAGGDRPGILQIGAIIGAVFQNIVAGLLSTVQSLLLFVAFALVYAICYAQVLWAKLAIGILIYLGPVLIPWLVFKPMAFLFWGWFRALWTYSLYSIIAAAVLRVFVALSITMIESINNALGVGLDVTATPELGTILIAVIPPPRRLLHGGSQGPRARLRHRRRLVGRRPHRRGRHGSLRWQSQNAQDGRRHEMIGLRRRRTPPDQKNPLPSKPKGKPDPGEEVRRHLGSRGDRPPPPPDRHLGAGLLRPSFSSSPSFGCPPSTPPSPSSSAWTDVGRAEALAYEAVEAVASPTDPSTKYFLNQFPFRLLRPPDGNGGHRLAAGRSASFKRLSPVPRSPPRATQSRPLRPGGPAGGSRGGSRTSCSASFPPNARPGRRPPTSMSFSFPQGSIRSASAGPLPYSSRSSAPSPPSCSPSTPSG